jgi:hypothetical protein
MLLKQLFKQTNHNRKPFPCSHVKSALLTDLSKLNSEQLVSFSAKLEFVCKDDCNYT